MNFRDKIEKGLAGLILVGSSLGLGGCYTDPRTGERKVDGAALLFGLAGAHGVRKGNAGVAYAGEAGMRHRIAEVGRDDVRQNANVNEPKGNYIARTIDGVDIIEEQGFVTFVTSDGKRITKPVDEINYKPNDGSEINLKGYEALNRIKNEYRNGFSLDIEITVGGFNKKIDKDGLKKFVVDCSVSPLTIISEGVVHRFYLDHTKTYSVEKNGDTKFYKLEDVDGDGITTLADIFHYAPQGGAIISGRIKEIK